MNKPATTSDARPSQIQSDPGAVVFAELLFVLLPLIVLVIVVAVHDPVFWSNTLSSPEWSFAAAILSGQSIVKIASGVVATPQQRPWSRVAFILSIVIVLLLVPSLTVLVLLLVVDPTPAWLIVLQFVLFALAILCFLIVGGAGQALLDGRT